MQITIPQRDLAAFSRMIGEMQRASGASVAKVVRNTGRDLAFALLKATPIAPKTKVRKFATRKTSDGRTVYIPLEKPKTYKVPNRGFAKQGWLHILDKLGKKSGPRYPGSRGQNTASKLHQYIMESNGAASAVEFANQVPYIADLDVGSRKNRPYYIMRKAVSATLEKMARILQERFNKDVATIWHR